MAPARAIVILPAGPATPGHSRAFWDRCDHALHAGGALLRGYDQLKVMIRAQQAEGAAVRQQRRVSKLRETATSDALTSPLLPAASADTVMVSVRLDGREVVVAMDRRVLLQAGFGTLLEAFALGPQLDELTARTSQASRPRVTVTSSAHVDEILAHLRKLWHALVRTDNLLGPRFALSAVLSQIAVVEALLPELRDEPRRAAVGLGAQYAESAAWLYEDAGKTAQARYWTSRAMEWAYEGDDQRMPATL